MLFLTVASRKNRHITPVSPRKQCDRENRRRTSPGNNVTAPADPITDPGIKIAEKISDGLVPETVSQRKSQTGRPGNNVTAPADPSYRSRNQIIEKITDGQG